MESLNNKTALVTGASRGIGKAVALALSDSGAKVAVNYYQSRKQAEEVCQLIENDGDRGIPIQVDVSEKSKVTELVETIEQELGPIDILINNAGIAQTLASEGITVNAIAPALIETDMIAKVAGVSPDIIPVTVRQR